MSTSLTSKLSGDFRAALETQPNAKAAAIVRFDRLDDSCEVETEMLGLTITRRLRLVRGLAVQGHGAALLQLAKSPRVVRIDPDEPVHTMTSEESSK